MQRRRLNWLVGVAVLPVVLAGCLPSKNPLSDSAKAKDDKRLIGVWRHKAPEGTGYFHVGRIDLETSEKYKFPEGSMVAVEVTVSKDGSLSSHRHLLFSTFLGNRWTSVWVEGGP